MDQKTLSFNYQAKLSLIYSSNSSKIKYLNKPGNNFQKVIILENSQIRVVAEFTPETSIIVLESLSLEVKYSEPQNLEKFYAFAEEELKLYYNRIRFLYSVSPHEILYTFSAKDHNGNGFISASGGFRVWGELVLLHNFDPIVYHEIYSLSDEILDTLIQEYLFVKRIKNLMYQLISAYNLYEKIGEIKCLEMKTFKKIDFKKKLVFFKYYRASNSEEKIMIIERLAFSARHLVSHGVVENRDTLQDLNDHFGTNLSSHTFDRKNEQHMDLVRWAAEQFLSVIKDYISSKILPEELRRKEHKIIRLEESN